MAMRAEQTGMPPRRPAKPLSREPMQQRIELGPKEVIEGARRQLGRPDLVENRRRILERLTRYLGVSGAGWVSEHRRALRELLCSTGLEAIEPVLAEVERAPRAEVVEDAANVLAALPVREQAVRALAEELERAQDWARRLTIVRGVAAMGGAEALASRRALLVAALRDRDADVRDAAVWGLGGLGDPSVRELLKRVLEREQVDFVRTSIEDVIEELGQG